MSICANGVYPAMLTPYDENGNVDYDVLKEITRWYIAKGCQGVFATCQSSEIFFLTLQERLKISKTVIETANGKMDVVISGHVEDDIEDQINSIKQMAALGAKAVVLITNRLAKQNETEQVMKTNVEKILSAVPDVDFGLYECPYPYLRLISPEFFKWCDDTDRFVFMKDVTCDITGATKKLNVIRGGKIKFFNANSTALLETIKNGAAGLCGVMGNFHPDLYIKMLEFAKYDMKKAEDLQDELGVMSIMNYSAYPSSAKYYLSLEGIHFKSFISRNNNLSGELPEIVRLEMEQRYRLTQRLRCGV